MKLSDLLGMTFRGLLERKLRTFLALLGVVIASLLILLCLAASEGVQGEVVRQFSMGDRLLRVEVFAGRGDVEEDVPAERLEIRGEMSDEKRERIRKAIVAHWNRSHFRPRVPLSSEKLERLRAIPHVEAVEPDVQRWATILFGDRVEQGDIRAVSVRNEDVQDQIVAGRALASNDDSAILVHEYLAYRFGFPGDDDVRNVIGRRIEIEVRIGAFLGTSGGVELTAAERRELNRVAARLPDFVDQLPLSKSERSVLKKAFASKTKDDGSKPRKEFVLRREFTIVGVFREPEPPEDESPRRRRRTGGEVHGADVVLGQGAAEEFVRNLPEFEEQGFTRATVIVDDVEHVESVVEDVKAMQLNHFALTDILKRVRFNIRVISYVMAVLGGVALLVAGLGIANTMVMTVLERTHEIGVMKAIGARDGDVQRLFLAEGAVLGLLGGLLGLLIGWGASFPVNDFIAQKLESEFRQPIESSLFSFPLWLTTGVPLFAATITTLAAVYPARRAAKIDPIVALRRE